MTSDPGASETTRRGRLSPTAGCLLSGCLGLVGIVLVGGVLAFALRGELTIGRGTPGEVRVWLITEGGNQGLGISAAKRISGTGNGTAECDTRQVGFLWQSETPAPAMSYCECYTRTSQGWESLGACPSN